ncbi:MAG: MarR family winged helix-turn-helix transcriptional regulator [Pseudomonadota bacterium]
MTPPEDPAAPDHIGLNLVRAAEAWEKDFNARMVAAGHTVFADARSRVIRYIGWAGIDQARLAGLSGMTKQAVNVHLDGLEAAGLVARVASPSDARQKRVVFTEAGLAMLADADRIKGEVEADYVRRIGSKPFADLRNALRALVADHQ